MLDSESRNPVSGFHHIHCPEIGEQGYAFLRLYELLFLFIFVIFSRLCIPSLGVSELTLHPAQTGVGFHLDIAAQMHPDFRTVVASQDRTVIHQSHLQAVSRGCRSSAHPGDSATGNNEVKLSDRRIGEIQLLFPESSEFLHGCRRTVLPLCEKNRITTSVKTGKVTQSKGDGPFLQADLAGRLPHPFITLRPEFIRKCLPVNLHDKPSRSPAGSPGGHPVVGSHPDLVNTTFRNSYLRGSIRDRHSKSVGKQIRRPHNVHELLVHDPASLVCETFCLNENAGRFCRNAPGEQAANGQKQSDDECFSHK